MLETKITGTTPTPTAGQPSPHLGPTTGNTLVTIAGSGLAGATTVQFGGVAQNVATATDSEVTVYTPISTVTGDVSVQVDVPTGLIPAGSFTFVAPGVQSVSPKSGPLAGGTEVTIMGNYLSGATAVQFGTVGATPTVVSDTELKVVTPAMPGAGVQDVYVNLPTGLTPANPKATFTFAEPAPANALFAIANMTGVPDELVFVKFLGAEINADTLPQVCGGGAVLAHGAKTGSQSYCLADIKAQLPGAPDGSKPAWFAINDYSGGRIYFSLGRALKSTLPPGAQLPNDPDFGVVYGYVEPSVFPTTAQGSTNIDASYVDFVGIPFDISVLKRADSTRVTPPANNPLTTQPGTAMFTALQADTDVPADAVVAPSTEAYPLKAGGSVTFGGIARILSPSLYDPSQFTNAGTYHGWTGTGSLIASLAGSSTKLNVASHSVKHGTAAVPANTLFGFAGSKTSTIATDWTKEQDYALTAEALTDLNPKGANPRIPQLEGVAGIKMTGTGTIVGSFDVYLTNVDLEAPTGVYGANPPYIVDWTDAPGGAAPYSLPQIENDLSGRVVGDLLAGFNFGWATCATTVSAQASTNGLAATLVGTEFDVTNGALRDTAIGDLTTGQLFYLLSLQPSTTDLAQWFGAALQPDTANYYNSYSNAFQAMTNCYNMAFTDRLQGSSDPDMFFTQNDDIFVLITLLPGGYTVTQTS